jgi:hypothetical protein
LADFYDLCEATEAYQNRGRKTRIIYIAQAPRYSMSFEEEGYEEGEDDGAQNPLLHDDNDDSDYNSDDGHEECFDVNVAAQFEDAHPDGIDTQGY